MRGAVVAGVLLGCGLSASACAASSPTAGPAQPPASVTDAPAASAPTAAVPVVDLRDPVAVARLYITERWSYSWTDQSGVIAALTATDVTTPRFAVASHPSEPALRRLLHARDTVSVTITNAGVVDEAPNSASTRFVDVGFTRYESYAGAAGPHSDPGLWQLRLVGGRDGWRVDGVPDGQ